MPSLDDFPITRKWAARFPDRLQLYSLPTANGQKVSMLLEELQLPYEPHRVEFVNNDQHSDAFLSLNPNGKIPAIIDPNGPDGQTVALFESGAILLYLADKTGRFIPQDPAGRWETVQWLMWQMGGLGPMFGQYGHFKKFAADKITDPYPRQRYQDESRRLLSVLDQRLADRSFIMGEELTIADFAVAPWVRFVISSYEGREDLGFDQLQRVPGYIENFFARPAIKRGRQIPKRG